MIRKVRQHINQNEPLIFENSSPGNVAIQCPAAGRPAVDPAAAWARKNTRKEIEDFPEVSEWKPFAISRACPPTTTHRSGLYPLAPAR